MNTDSIDFSVLKTVFQFQARFCRESQSPFSALVLEQIAAGIGDSEPYDTFLQAWWTADARAIFTDAVPLRMLGAMHGLALSGAAPTLAALYPPNVNDDDAALDRALAQAAQANATAIQRFMASPPQTNEVGRALCLVGGFLTVAKETGLPLRCLELGASAGLNMNWDRFGYRFGEGAAWGDPASPVQLSGEWTGGSPPLVPARVVSRAACDQAPIDVNDPAEALRLQSYVWPDQTLRLERLRAAIKLKQQTGGTPERADAADWAEAHVNPQAGVATVVYHSSFMPYPPQATQDRIKAAIERAGQAATAQAPLAWLSKEADREKPLEHDEVLLRVWRGAKDDGAVRRLARVHPHGTWVDWLGG
jgi:hypothetical protein